MYVMYDVGTTSSGILLLCKLANSYEQENKVAVLKGMLDSVLQYPFILKVSWTDRQLR